MAYYYYLFLWQDYWLKMKIRMKNGRLTLTAWLAGWWLKSDGPTGPAHCDGL